MAIQYIDVVNGSDTFQTVSITGATKANPCVITSNAHGLDNGQWIRLTSVGGMTQLNNNVYKTSNVAANTFELQDLNGNNINSTAYTTYTSGGTATQWRKIPISAITKANPAVVTAKKHGFSNGNLVILEDVVGMTQVNNVCYSVANATTDTFELSGIDSSAYGTYTSGGTATRPFKAPNSLEAYRGAVASPQNTFWMNGDTVKHARTFKYADIAVGSGNIVFTKNSATVTTSVDLRASISQYDFIGLTTARLDGCSSNPTSSRPDVFYRVEAITASAITLQCRYGEATTTVSSVYRLRLGTEIQTMGTATGAWTTASNNVVYEGGYSFNESGAVSRDSGVGASAYRPYDTGDYHMLYLNGGSGNTANYLNFLNTSRGFGSFGLSNTFNYCSSYSINIYSYYLYSTASGSSCNYCLGVQSASGYYSLVAANSATPISLAFNYCYAISGASSNTTSFNGANYSTFNYCCSNNSGFYLQSSLAKAYNCLAINCNRTSSFYGYYSTGAYFSNCNADNCNYGYLNANQSEGIYVYGGTVSNCTYGVYAQQSSGIVLEGVSFTGNNIDFYQDVYCSHSNLINCSSTTPTSYMLSRPLYGGAINASGCSIDAPSIAKAFQVVAGNRYGTPQYTFQNSFGITGQYKANGYYLEDSSTYRTSSPSMKLAINSTISGLSNPIKVASFYVAGGTAKTVTYYLKRDSGAWAGTITPQLRLNGKLIKTGTDITSLDNDWLTSRTISATSGEISEDGELSLEFIYNANNIAIWIDDVGVS